MICFSYCSNGAGKNKDQNESDPLIAKGKRLYIYCEACHETKDIESIKLGPHLENIMNRQAGIIDGFAYSDSLKQKDFIWNEENMIAWIKQPAKFLPGTTMVFAGLKEQDQIDALMAYLKTL